MELTGIYSWLRDFRYQSGIQLHWSSCSHNRPYKKLQLTSDLILAVNISFTHGAKLYLRDVTQAYVQLNTTLNREFFDFDTTPIIQKVIVQFLSALRE